MITPRKGLLLVVLVLLLCGLLNARWTGWLSRPVTNTIDTVQYPAGWVASRLKSDPPIKEKVYEEDELRDKLRETQRYNAELWVENAELQEQIEAFKAIANIQDIKAIRPVQAPVSAYNADPVNPTMKLLRGSLQGIKVDDAVAYKQNLIGFIQEVGPLTSTVKLITSQDFRSEVMIMPPDRVRAGNNWPYIDWVESDKKGGFYIGEIAKSTSSALRPGDVVRVRDSLRKSANGFVLGEIISIEDHPTNPTQDSRVHIAPNTPIGPQREVTVITDRTD